MLEAIIVGPGQIAPTYAALAFPAGFGWIADRGLIKAHDLSKLEVVAIVITTEVMIFATYVIARLSRREDFDLLVREVTRIGEELAQPIGTAA